MAVNLERGIRSPAKRNDRPFKVTSRRIKIYRPHTLKVGRWRHYHFRLGLMGISQTRDDFKVALQAIFQPALPIDHQGKFSKRHPMDSRHREGSDPGLILHLQDRTVNIEPVGIGPIQDDDLLVAPGA